MGAEIKIDFVGADRIMRNLDRLVELAEENLEDIAVVGALPIANEAKRRARVKTGNMKRSVHVGGHASKTPDTRIGADVTNYGEVSGPVRSEGKVTLSVGTRVGYAWTIEFGGGGRISASAKTALAKYGGGASGGNFRPAYPFLRPAADDPATRKKAARQAEAAYKLIVRRALGGVV